MNEWNLTEEAIENFLNKMKKQEEIKKDFTLNYQDEAMELIYLHLKNNRFIDNENIVYYPDKYSFTEQEFCWIFDNLMEYANSINKSETEDDNPFPNFNFFLRYKETKIVMRIMWGQGTAMQMYIASEEDWNEEKSFSYEEYKEFLPETIKQK